MKSPTSLFDLINTLTPAEKGYFKKHVQHEDGSGKIYVKLFDAINAQEVYDEKKIKVKFRKEISNFSAAKNYLYDSILNSLMTAHKRVDLFAQSCDMLAKADILAGRHLIEDAKGFLEKAHLLADRNFEPAIHLQAFDRLLMIASVQNNQPILQELAENGLSRAMKWVDDLKTDVVVRQAVSWLGLYRMIYAGPSTDEEREKFIHRAQDFIDLLKTVDLSLHHQMTFEQLYAAVCEETGDFADGYRHIENILEILKRPELNQPDMDMNRVVMLWNAASYCMRYYMKDVLKHADSLKQYIDHSVTPSGRMVSIVAERFWYMIMFRYYNQTGELDRAAKIAQDIRIWFDKNEKSVPPPYCCSNVLRAGVSLLCRAGLYPRHDLFAAHTYQP